MSQANAASTTTYVLYTRIHLCHVQAGGEGEGEEVGDDRGCHVLPGHCELLAMEHGVIDTECRHEDSRLSGLEAGQLRQDITQHNFLVKSIQHLANTHQDLHSQLCRGGGGG